ncbi:MAG: sigma-54 interaction domain-containing protein, partial [Candidatus Hydrogenedens sp.]
MNKDSLLTIWKEVAKHNRIEDFLIRIIPEIKKEIFTLESIDILVIHRKLKILELISTPKPTKMHKMNHISLTEEMINQLQKFSVEKSVFQGTEISLPGYLFTILSSFYEHEWFSSIFLSPLEVDKSIEGILIGVLKKNGLIPDRIKDILKILQKPFSVALANHIRILEMETLKKAEEAEKINLLRKLGRESFGERIIGENTGLKYVMERVKLVASSDLPVLILGETGTGKELIARALHKNSNRAQGPIIRVNCGAIPPELIDSQLFGHEKGSFTGAVEKHIGWFERADGGTLFLDEIGDLPLHAQVRLLRILQDGWFERVGGKEPIHVDVRLVTATNSDLAQLVVEKKFREDLFYRISTFPIILPPLRERKEDIPEMAKYFAEKSAQRFSLPVVYPTEDDIELLCHYSWPGNVRELASVIDRSAILGNGKKLEIAHALGLSNTKQIIFMHKSKEETEEIIPLNEYNKRYIEYVLSRTNGKIDGKGG